jgi:hypothetical protein
MHWSQMKGVLIGAVSVAVLAIAVLAVSVGGGKSAAPLDPAAATAQAQQDPAPEALPDEQEALPDEQEAEESTEAGGRIDFDMRLRSAEIHSFNLDDQDEEFVRVKFTNTVQDFEENPSAYTLVGFDPENTTDATSVRLDEDDDRSLIVGFEQGTDLRSHTILTVDREVVQDREGNGNVQDWVALDGANIDEGRTSAPEALRFNLDDSLNRIEIRFDEELDESGGDASQIGYVTANGDLHEAEEIASVEDDLVIVSFDERDDVTDAERLVVGADAVKDRQGTGNVPTARGGETAAPDLESVSAVGGSDTQWDFRFDEAIVADGESSGLALYTEDGTRYEAEDVTTIDGDTLRASFPEVDDFADQVTLAVADRGAVQANDGGAAESTLGVDAVGAARLDEGSTAGPDLRVAEVTNEDAGHVRLTFDEAIDDDADIKADGIAVITQSGALESADAIVERGDEGERFVIVSFPESAVEAAEAVTIDGGVIQDFQENANPQATVAITDGGDSDEDSTG